LFSFYALTERVAFAAECESSTDLHVDKLYGVVQLVDDQGTVITEPGKRGELVATGLLSAAAPLLRYRTGDMGEWAADVCPCGHVGPRLRGVTGHRRAEFLITTNQGRVSMTALNMHSRVFDLVTRFRFVQTVPGEARLLVVPGHGYGAETRAGIEAELLAKLDGQVRLTVQEVDDIPLSPVGKHHYIDQLVDQTGSG
jgi:phenylacetate-CoA ligase